MSDEKNRDPTDEIAEQILINKMQPPLLLAEVVWHDAEVAEGLEINWATRMMSNKWVTKVIVATKKMSNKRATAVCSATRTMSNKWVTKGSRPPR